MNTVGITPEDYSPQEQLYVWALFDPSRPRLVGELELGPLLPDCAQFRYLPGWWHFPLSEDLPLISGHTFSAQEKSSAPGALASVLLRLALDGYYDLSPAYDVVPSLQNGLSGPRSGHSRSALQPR